MNDGRGRRVVALVLSHNAPQSLARCLNAIGHRRILPDEIVVVDNASDPPVQIDHFSFPGVPAPSHPIGRQSRTSWRLGYRSSRFLKPR